MNSRYKHGQQHPTDSSLVFWSYRPKGREYWVTPDEFTRKVVLRNVNRREIRKNPEVRKKDAEYQRVRSKTDAGKSVWKKFYSSHREKYRAWNSAWQKNNRDKVNATIRKHILPLAMFDLTREDHQRIAFNFRNYRPSWWQENLSKKDKLDLALVTKHELEEALAML